MEEMIRFERGILKDIADQVRVYNQEKQRKKDHDYKQR